MWLASIGIFRSEEPAISYRELAADVTAGRTIDEIRRRHRVTDRTVVVELYRHGLFEAHRRRHLIT